jgi:hypothetical protein
MSSHKNMSDRPTLERVKSVPCPSPPDPIHSELIDELDQIRQVRKARDSRAAELLSMSNRSAIEKIQTIPCPTCDAQPGEKCELHPGQPRTEPHRERRLAAEDLLNR